MSARLRQQVVRRPPDAREGSDDYADAYEVAAHPALAPMPPAVWIRAGIGEVPGWVRPLTRLLGMTGRSQPGRVGPFSVADSSPDAARLTLTTSLLAAELVGRNAPGGGRRPSTYVTFRTRRARWAWRLLGPLHRRLVRRILIAGVERAAG